MRIAVVIGLAIVAIAAAGVWALGQFGGALTGGVGEARAPIVREPDLVAANTPAKPKTPNAAPSLQSQQTPTTPTTTEPTTPPAVNPTKPNSPLTSRLDDPGSQIVQPQSVPTTPEPPQQQAVAPGTTEPKVTTQNTPTGTPTATATSLETQFKMRKLTYNRPPAKLALDKAIDISLIIDTTGDANAAEKLKDLPGTVVERDVALSDFVSAELIGADFDIQLQTTASRQKLSAKLANEWRWRVTPTAEGKHTLTLKVYGYATGSLDAEPLNSYRDEITVEVQQLDQLVSWARGVQPLFAVLAALAGACSAGFAFMRFREEKKRNKPAA